MKKAGLEAFENIGKAIEGLTMAGEMAEMHLIFNMKNGCSFIVKFTEDMAKEMMSIERDEEVEEEQSTSTEESLKEYIRILENKVEDRTTRADYLEETNSHLVSELADQINKVTMLEEELDTAKRQLHNGEKAERNLLKKIHDLEIALARASC